MPIPTLHHLDRATLDRHVRSGTPFLVPGFAREWPACTKWSPEYLAEKCGSSPIPVSRYEDDEVLVCKEKMTVRDYLAAITATPDSWRNHYMESVVLSDLSSELYRDVPIPADLDDLPDIADTVFFGRNTGSCCHIHPHEEAIVFQLMGTKTFYLYHPREVRDLYFEPITQDYRRSRIDFPKLDYDRFPRARLLHRIDVVLEPGDVLYLPVHWAHWTAAEGFTFTLTRFFQARLRHYRFPSPGVRCVLGRLIQTARGWKV
jgi:hypothetical protein